jgi:hypothetical protein
MDTDQLASGSTSQFSTSQSVSSETAVERLVSLADVEAVIQRQHVNVNVDDDDNELLARMIPLISGLIGLGALFGAIGFFIVSSHISQYTNMKMVQILPASFIAAGVHFALIQVVTLGIGFLTVKIVRFNPSITGMFNPVKLTGAISMLAVSSILFTTLLGFMIVFPSFLAFGRGTVSLEAILSVLTQDVIMEMSLILLIIFAASGGWTLWLRVALQKKPVPPKFITEHHIELSTQQHGFEVTRILNVWLLAMFLLAFLLPGLLYGRIYWLIPGSLGGGESTIVNVLLHVPEEYNTDSLAELHGLPGFVGNSIRGCLLVELGDGILVYNPETRYTYAIRNEMITVVYSGKSSFLSDKVNAELERTRGVKIETDSVGNSLQCKPPLFIAQ